MTTSGDFDDSVHSGQPRDRLHDTLLDEKEKHQYAQPQDELKIPEECRDRQ
jgi:hypothetical protein